MTTTSPMHGLPAATRRRLIVIGLLRASATTVVLVAAYYLLPLDHLAGVALGVTLAAGLLVLTAVSAYQVRAIIKARYPAIRAIEALAATAPLFLLLFAATYYVMAQADLSNFNVHSLTRTDALYFTVTVFATVGFGDITATTQVGPPHRHRADDPRPGSPRPRDPRVPRSGPAWPPTTHCAAGDRIFVSASRGQASVGAIGHVDRRRGRPSRGPVPRWRAAATWALARCRGGPDPGGQHRAGTSAGTKRTAAMRTRGSEVANSIVRRQAACSDRHSWVRALTLLYLAAVPASVIIDNWISTMRRAAIRPVPRTTGPAGATSAAPPDSWHSRDSASSANSALATHGYPPDRTVRTATSSSESRSGGPPNTPGSTHASGRSARDAAAALGQSG